MNERIDIKQIVVDEMFEFYGIEVGGSIVPTKEIVKSIMETIPDIESRIRFMVASNMWVNNHHSIFTDNQYIIERDNPAFEEMELRKRLIEIDKRECEITGFSFDELCYCRALIS